MAFDSTISKWKWIVLISCFFVKMFVQGIRKSFGVLLPTLERQFDSKVWLLGSAVAFFCAVGDFLGKSLSHISIFFCSLGLNKV